MQIFPLSLLCWTLLFATAAPAVAIAASSGHGGRERQRELKDAMGVAEAETGGEAVTVRRVSMNGTISPDGLGGIEVLVHMDQGQHGWRCLIDSNTMRLRSKERIANPPSKVR